MLNMVGLPYPSLPHRHGGARRVAVFIEGQDHTVEDTEASEFRVILVELK
jgi:hypothetical protein